MEKTELRKKLIRLKKALKEVNKIECTNKITKEQKQKLFVEKIRVAQKINELEEQLGGKKR